MVPVIADQATGPTLPGKQQRYRRLIVDGTDHRLISMREATHVINGLSIAIKNYPANSVISLHSHNESDICLVLRGNYMDTVDRRETSCVAGSAIFYDPAWPHAQQIGPNRVTKLILKPGGAPFPAFDKLGGFGRREVVTTKALYQLSCRVAEERRIGDSFSQIAIEGLAWEIVAQFGRETLDSKKMSLPEWVRHVRERLDDNTAEMPTVAQLARDADREPSELVTAFRRSYGREISSYLRHSRLTKAAHLLSTTCMPLARIAAELGFSDQAHFSRSFKQSFGVSPLKFRNGSI